MLKRFWLLLAATLAAVSILPGCGDRSFPGEASAVSSAASVSAPSSEPEPDAEPDAAPSAPAPEPLPGEPEASAPALSDVDRELVTRDLHAFLSCFADTRKAESAGELDQEAVLTFLLAEINQQQELLGYYFAADEEGNSMIPADLVAENAERLLGLPSFKPDGSALYDKKREAYRFDPKAGGGASLPEGITVSEPRGGPDNTLSYDVRTSDHTSRFAFRLLRINGMPYLQFVSITPQ